MCGFVNYFSISGAVKIRDVCIFGVPSTSGEDEPKLVSTGVYGTTGYGVGPLRDSFMKNVISGCRLYHDS
jgi:hypothetical protein